MSSMRNAVQRRVHRERAQPAAREKWGILEKHKDYSLRAKDYNIKKAQLQRLREKARDRNPDEFAYGMMSERSKTHGKHGARESKSLNHATVSLLKTQDAGYLRVVGERVRRQLVQTEQEVNLQKGIEEAESLGGKKTIFVDSVEEQQEKAYRDEEDDSEDDSVNGELDSGSAGKQKQATGTISKKQLEAEKQARKEIFKARRLKEKAAESRLKKLETLKQQHADISAAEEELALQRAKMARSVGGSNKQGIKWKVRERKK
ncbi:U3 snoRNP-associated protein Utp11 [Arthroderma uncinatum]|uniref:U3 snoRNP-associated protein Utp11 n=1 Tax=Arthroderma uncinatum TaxID=74035 RepID=UPI00144ACB85|nr:U3 snoRNP-associated protein Utp11 [Arthroderma uncinatum]KAF3491263.1 U3 snoRNP-associated protein Utp11 [Arthroderma uncinatum]